MQAQRRGDNMLDFICEHPYISVNVICAAFTGASCVCEPLRQISGSILIFTVLLGVVVFPYLVIINFISFFAVLKDKTGLGIFLSLIGGSVGSFIASSASDKKSTALNVIFKISVWFVICVIVSGVIFIENDFRLVGF